MLCSACFPFPIWNLFSKEIADKTDHADFETMKDLCSPVTKLIDQAHQSRDLLFIYIYSSIQYDFVSTIYPFIIIYPMYVTLTKPVEAFKYFNLAGCELAVSASSHIGHSFDLSDYHDLAIVIFRVDELPVVGVVDTELTVLQADSQDVYVQLCEFNDPLVPVVAVGFLN